MAKQNSKKVREQREKSNAKAAYLGTTVALILIGVIGIVIWLVGRSPNVTVMKVGDIEIKKDLYTCTYYFGTMTSQNWKEQGFDIYTDPYEQPLDHIANGKEVKSWGAYFEILTKDSLEFMVVMTDTAQKKGYTYTEEVLSHINSEFASIEQEKGQAMSWEEYMLRNYGASISQKTLKQYLDMYYKAADFYKAITTSKALFNRYITGDNTVFETTYEKNPDAIDVVSFRYILLPNTAQNAATIQALENAASEEEFKDLCNRYKNDESYTKEDSSLFTDIPLKRISILKNSLIPAKLADRTAKEGDILAAPIEENGTECMEIAYLVKPRAKDTSAYEESDVQKWEFEAMSLLLEEYYDSEYQSEIVEKGFAAFKEDMIIPTSTASSQVAQ